MWLWKRFNIPHSANSGKNIESINSNVWIPKQKMSTRQTSHRCTCKSSKAAHWNKHLKLMIIFQFAYRFRPPRGISTIIARKKNTQNVLPVKICLFVCGHFGHSPIIFINLLHAAVRTPRLQVQVCVCARSSIECGSSTTRVQHIIYHLAQINGGYLCVRLHYNFLPYDIASWLQWCRLNGAVLLLKYLIWLNVRFWQIG